MKRKRPRGETCPDRTGDLEAAWHELNVLEGVTFTRANVDDLISAVDRYVSITRGTCTARGRRGNYCDVCGRMLQREMWQRLTKDDELPWMVSRALGSAEFSGDWPRKFLREQFDVRAGN